MYPFGEKFSQESQGINKKEVVGEEGVMAGWGESHHSHAVFRVMTAMQMKTDHNY